MKKEENIRVTIAAHLLARAFAKVLVTVSSERHARSFTQFFAVFPSFRHFSLHSIIYMHLRKFMFPNWINLIYLLKRLENLTR